MDAFAAAVEVFGRGQVSTYILAGLGDSDEAILGMSERLIALGVYPFVVPFVPISGTPLEDHPSPDAAAMRRLLARWPACWKRPACARATPRPAAASAAPAPRCLRSKGSDHERCGRESVAPATARRRGPGVRIKLALDKWEREQARRLRRDVFCAEQGVFQDDDTDAIDAIAMPIVAVMERADGSRRWSARCASMNPRQACGTARAWRWRSMRAASARSAAA
jgi:hypothetical protein